MNADNQNITVWCCSGPCPGSEAALCWFIDLLHEPDERFTVALLWREKLFWGTERSGHSQLESHPGARNTSWVPNRLVFRKQARLLTSLWFSGRNINPYDLFLEQSKCFLYKPLICTYVCVSMCLLLCNKSHHKPLKYQPLWLNVSDQRSQRKPVLSHKYDTMLRALFKPYGACRAIYISLTTDSSGGRPH